MGVIGQRMDVPIEALRPEINQLTGGEVNDL
jgi:hypothetical protein